MLYAVVNETFSLSFACNRILYYLELEFRLSETVRTVRSLRCVSTPRTACSRRLP